MRYEIKRAFVNRWALHRFTRLLDGTEYEEPVLMYDTKQDALDARDTFARLEKEAL